MNNDKPTYAVTVEQFVTLVLRELDFTSGAREEFLRRAGTVLRTETQWSVASGSLAYYADDVFWSLQEISREEAATLMSLASELVGDYSPKLSRSEVVSTMSRYKDAKLVSAWAMQAIATAVEQKWIGCPNSEIKPKHYITPYEAVTIVKRFATDIQ